MEYVDVNKNASNEEVEFETQNNPIHANKPVSQAEDGYVLDSRTGNIRNFYTLFDESPEDKNPCLCMKGNKYYACKSILRPFNLGEVQPQIKIMHRLAGQKNIAIKDVFEDNLGVHIVMELCTGGSILGKPYLEKDAAKLIKIILEVIELCHSQGITIEVDQKTFIFVDDKKNSDSLQAIHFGSAKFFQPVDLVAEAVQTQNAKKNDMQAAGRILCELLTGNKNPSEKDLKDISSTGKKLIKEMRKGLPAHDVLSNPWFLENGVAPEKASDTAHSDLQKFIGILKDNDIKIGE